MFAKYFKRAHIYSVHFTNLRCVYSNLYFEIRCSTRPLVAAVTVFSQLADDVASMLSLKYIPKAKFFAGYIYKSGPTDRFRVSAKCLNVEMFVCVYKRHQNAGGLHTKSLNSDHSSSKPQRKVCELVLEHFDLQYSEELGQQWLSAREVLLNPYCWQYGVLLNRFSDLTGVQTFLKLLGYYSQLHQTDSLNSQSLQCLVPKDAVRLPTQRHREGWLKQYYLLNAASLLPVLALEVRDGESVLDLCSAPGGKAVAVLQAANPGLLHCNEVDKARYEWLVKTLESYIPPALRDTITLTNMDGRDIGSNKSETFDKVLVDAPCSNDRSWLFTPIAQQGELWMRERAKLPQLQKELLCSALAAVRPGGLVVYSTCTFSRAENQSVVESVLSSSPGVELLELEEKLIGSLSSHFTFASLQLPLGHLVIPAKGRTWGPMFVCRLRRNF